MSPYIVPGFINIFHNNYPEIELSIQERTTSALLVELAQSNIDVMIAATPIKNHEFIEIPLYYAHLVAYFHDENDPEKNNLSADEMPIDNLWVLQEGHCMRSQTFNFCKNNYHFNRMYEAGSIDTLIRIVDRNGGYSVIPEMHIPFLTEDQKKHIGIIENPPAVREVSLLIRRDFIKERLINAVADTIKKIIPEEMWDSRLKKFSIKL